MIQNMKEEETQQQSSLSFLSFVLYSAYCIVVSYVRVRLYVSVMMFVLVCCMCLHGSPRPEATTDNQPASQPAQPSPAQPSPANKDNPTTR